MAVFLVMNLAACQELPFGIEIPWLMPEVEVPVTTPTSDLSQVTPDPAENTTPTPALPPESLTIWLPPEMNPEGEGDVARLLKTQLDAFSQSNGGITVNVRLKEISGAGGLLDALTATSAAAPDALPDLIALPRKDLETAALKSLVLPMDTLTSIVDDVDWYPYARDLALIQGAVFGIPFSGDALAMIYRSDGNINTVTSWGNLFETSHVIAFAADDPQAGLTLTLYQAVGGAVQDNQRRPMLDALPLTEVLKLYKSGVETGNFTDISLQSQTEAQVWLAYQQGQADLAVVSVSRFLKSKLEDTSMAPLPMIAEIGLTTGTGWVWALATPLPERQSLSVRLAEALVESQFLSKWTEALSRMPARPSALEGWQDPGIRAQLNQISMMTILSPSNDIISSLGPILRDASLQVLREQVDPGQAAKTAVESLQ